MRRKTFSILNAIIMTNVFLSTLLRVIFSDRSNIYKIVESILGIIGLVLAVYWWIKVFTGKADEDDEYDEEDDDDESEEE